METLNTKEKYENKNQEAEKHGSKDMYRVIISKEAKLTLDELLKKANEGFEAGEITKSDIVNAVLLNSSKYFNESEIKLLRAQHFDEAKVLAALLKGMNQGDALPESIKAVLRSQYGLVDNQKRKQNGSAH